MKILVDMSVHLQPLDIDAQNIQLLISVNTLYDSYKVQRLFSRNDFETTFEVMMDEAKTLILEQVKKEETEPESTT